MTKSAQRVYSDRALEAWMQRVLEPWEEAFSADVLEAGRSLYRSGEIRSMELSEDLAIVSVKRGKIEVYSMVEWDGGPSHRSSAEDRAAGAALAVAGLYEIEELVADEIPAVPAELISKAAPTANGDAVESPDPRSEDGESPALRSSMNGGSDGSAGRGLRIRLESVAQGIRMQAFWRNGTDTGQLASAFAHAPVGRVERERLIRLTGAARRSHFRFREPMRDYLLDDIGKIPAFVNRELPRWRALFGMVETTGLEGLGEGVREAVPRVGIRGTGESVRIRIGFELDGGLLPAGGADRLASARGETVLLSGYGLVRVHPERAGDLGTWLDATGGRLEEELPPYMIFSFLGCGGERVELSDDVEQWRRCVEDGTGDGMKGLPEFLRPYQRTSVLWMRRLLEMGCHALLADEMGLGKTLQVLSLLDTAWRREEPVLVVCPASVIPVWEMEVRRFFPNFLTECLRRDSDLQAAPPGMVWVCSYSQLRRRRKDAEGVQWGFVVLDEAQFIKNPEAKVTQACFALRARHRIALTGTPVENRHLDLWTIFRFLMPGLLGSRRRLETALASRPAEETAQLAHQVAPFVLRRTKRAVAPELPEKTEVSLYCPLTDVQRNLYRELTRRGSRRYTGSLSENFRMQRMGVLSLLTRLRQVCCDPSLVPTARAERGHSGKLHSLLPKLTEVVAAGSKAVVFSQFVGFLERTREAVETGLPGLPVYELTGRTVDRETPVRRFQTSKEPSVFLISLRAGGVGITLHSADYVFLMDPWWNPAVEAQAVDRVHRIGQKQPVIVYRMVTRGTVEERIEALKDSKRGVFDALVRGNGDTRWNDLDTHFDSLKALIGYNGGMEE
ncbi:MAG: DEAD/DEAH box helicase [Opitutales bacterium]|nr:DEAD/DEAH box helicase [Opitutales bacterium]